MNSRPRSTYFLSQRRLSPSVRRAWGYTLVEILVALTLSLLLMTAVVQVFAGVGNGISKSRRALEQFDRLRTAAQILHADLNGATARLDGRAGRPEEALGYLELIEGSYLFAASGPNGPYYGVDNTGKPDYTVVQRGDILMFTVRNAARPFVGRYGYDSKGSPQTVQSDVAEVCWFLRGNRLHRRVLLVVPGAAQALSTYSKNNKSSFYNDYDLSVHLNVSNGAIVPNSLADLVKRENRFGHDARQFPFDVRGWGTYGLPTLAECSSPTWMAPINWVNGSTPAPKAGPTTPIDMWDNSASGTIATNLSDQALNANQDGLRVSDDVVLTNVIGFDVKVWDPDANNYVDLGNAGTTATLQTYPGTDRFANSGIKESGLAGKYSGLTSNASAPQCIYDSGCSGYANEAGLGNSRGTNGLNDDGNGVVDDTSELIVRSGTYSGLAPGVMTYPSPLRGIQIKIRCFEPDSRQVREITIEHDFLPK